MNRKLMALIISVSMVLSFACFNVAMAETSENGARVWASTYSATVARGYQNTITIYTEGEYDHMRCAYKNDGPVDIKWGDFERDGATCVFPLYIIGKSIGNDTLNVTLEGTANNGEQVLASIQISVSVMEAGGSRANKITASNVKKKQSSKAQSFNLNASAKGGAKLSYESDQDAVKVNGSGKVTIGKNFCGKANIKITAAAKGEYKETSKTVTVTVTPGKTKITIKSATTAKISFSWKKVPNASGYICTGKVGKRPAAKADERGNTNFNDTLRVTGGKFAHNERFTLKMRAYKIVGSKRIYGPWVKKTGKIK